VIIWSRNFTSPDVDLVNPPIIRRRVDLPHPEGPVSVTYWFFEAVKETSLRTGSCSFSFLKSRLMCSTEINGIPTDSSGACVEPLGVAEVGGVSLKPELSLIVHP